MEGAGVYDRQYQYRYQFGDLTCDEQSLEIRSAGTVILDSNPLLAELLFVFLSSWGNLLSKDRVIAGVDAWRGKTVSDATFNQAISRLRKIAPEIDARLTTVFKQGYRFDFRKPTPIAITRLGPREPAKLDMAIGDPVPLRNTYRLERVLSQSHESIIWLAKGPETSTLRVFKFALSGVQLSAIKRELTIWQTLTRTLDDCRAFVPVVDSNFAEKPYFIACDYCGENLTSWATQENRLAASTTHERLAIFCQIVDAVAAAHGVPILHKDLKAENILIDQGNSNDWHVRLADFGQGLLLDSNRLDQLQIERLGFTTEINPLYDSQWSTHLYLAPELREGQSATARSDIYSLGVLLYQLLAGNLKSSLPGNWKRQIGDALLCSDIEKATAINPTDRFGSAFEFAEQLRLLEQRRNQVREREAEIKQARAAFAALQRSRARRPWLIAATACLVGGLALSTWQYSLERQAHRQTLKARNKAQAINDFLNRDVLARADPSTPGGGRTISLKDALDQAGAHLSSRFNDDPPTKASVALTLGNAFFGMGDYSSAENFLRQAVELLKNTDEENSDLELESQYMLARTFEMQVRYQDAEALITQTDKEAGPKLDPPSPLSLLAAWVRGGNSLMQMRPTSALSAYEKAEKTRLIVAPEDISWLFRIRGNLAWCYVRTQRDADALRLLAPLLDTAYPPERVGATDWAKVHLQYGLALSNLGQYQEADRALTATIDQLRQTLGPTHYVTGVALDHLATVRQMAGNWHEAIAAADEAYPIMQAVLGDNGQNTLVVRGHLAILQYLSTSAQAALPALHSAYTAIAQRLGTTAPLTQVIGYYLAAACVDSGDIEQAAAIVSSLAAEPLAAGEPGPYWPERLTGLQARVHIAHGMTTEGLHLLKSAIERLELAHAPDWSVAPMRAALPKDHNQ